MRYFLIIVLLFLFYRFAPAQQGNADWPIFRGTADLSGRSDFELPVSPQLLWSVSTGVRTKSSPVVSDGTVYFGNEKGTMNGIGTDGKFKLKYIVGSALDAAPLVFGKELIFGTNDGFLRAIDKTTGRPLWSYHTDNQIAGSANVWLSGNKAGIVVGSYDYYLHCVDPENGKSLWKIETENYVNGTPSILNGRIVFGGCDGIIRIIEPLTGKQKDTINIGIYIAASPALSSDLAYFGDYDGTIYCLNVNSKEIIWKISTSEESGAILAIPAIRNDAMIVGSENKYLYCFNASDGKLKWKYRTNGRITGSAVIASSNVLFTSMDGNVYIVRLADGKKLWSFNAGTPVSSSPAVVKGRFYILTEDGRLLAFGEKVSKK
jgi:eukaryotic-like serine/threonine-protein kinase